MILCSFSNLPPEIRQYIWTLSFEPRVLCLHVQECTVPKYSDCVSNYLNRGIDNPFELVAVSFTCTVLGPSNAKTPDEAFEARADSIPRIGRMTKKVVEGLRTMSPDPTSLGPVQLYVCSESRAVAMKKYQLAFPGVDVDAAIDIETQDRGEDANPRRKAARGYWYQRKLWEKRIWVDFNNDIILVDTISRRPDVLRAARESTLLRFLTEYAGEDMKKITRLAIVGKWQLWQGSEEIASLLYNTGSNEFVSWHLLHQQRERPTCIEFFENLRELLVDDGLKIPKGDVRTLEQREDFEDLEAGILGFLGRLNRVRPTWSKLPKVRLIRWDEWSEL